MFEKNQEDKHYSSLPLWLILILRKMSEFHFHMKTFVFNPRSSTVFLSELKPSRLSLVLISALSTIRKQNYRGIHLTNATHTH